MRSPTLNNIHSSPHDMNTNQQQQQQSNGNGVCAFIIYFLINFKEISLF